MMHTLSAIPQLAATPQLSRNSIATPGHKCFSVAAALPGELEQSLSGQESRSHALSSPHLPGSQGTHSYLLV